MLEELADIKLNDKTDKKKLKKLIPEEWLHITINDKTVKDTIKKLGSDVLTPGIIPGIEIYEDIPIVRSTSISSDKKEKKDIKGQKTKNGMAS